MNWLRRWLFVIVLAAIHLYAFPYFGALKHANELPRVLTTQELVYDHTFALDTRMKELGSTADISITPAKRNFQNKAPGLSVLGVVVYAPVALAYHLVGAGRPSMVVSTWLLRIFVVTIPAVLFLPLFRRFATRFGGDDTGARDGALIAYAFGSLAFPYALLFMSHVTGAVLVGSAFVIASRLTRGELGGRLRSKTWAAAVVGLVLGLAMFVEYQAIFGAAVIFVFVVVRSPGERLRVALAMSAAALPWIVVLGVYHHACFGSAFRTGYEYSADDANRVGFMGVVGPSLKSLRQLFANGNNGLWVLSPWIPLSVFGTYGVLREPELRARAGAETIAAGAICVVYALFVASLEPEFGRAGWCVGPRYIAIAVPFFAWLGASGIVVCREHPLLLVPALGSIFVGVVINVLAATTYPHWPTEIVNPVFEVSFRLLGEGRAPHSLGTFVGLRGVASLVPLYAAIIAVVFVLLNRGGVRWVWIGAASVLALVAILRLRSFARTPEPRLTPAWEAVSRTYEP